MTAHFFHETQLNNSVPSGIRQKFLNVLFTSCALTAQTPSSSLPFHFTFCFENPHHRQVKYEATNSYTLLPFLQRNQQRYGEQYLHATSARKRKYFFFLRPQKPTPQYVTSPPDQLEKKKLYRLMSAWRISAFTRRVSSSLKFIPRNNALLLELMSTSSEFQYVEHLERSPFSDRRGVTQKIRFRS